ncbi:TauD/TfdA family dioxygenase [Colwellia psychrerythraea]|uniref:Taurine catabolism dioxygenase TauD/TfdA n=1 Tax=Colwellia psychrerythraea TaxID=28229 RepID=A0A099KUY5_COLPS|nr:TauD/TfdA family dioxygenase [Colwellia psychrerythraea]KGJ94020.1 Taurine catabolism dioxygenase TauD/TfdA [Colwellia psychrerythraea]
MNNIITATQNSALVNKLTDADQNSLTGEKTITLAKQHILKNGWVLLRGFNTNLNEFSALLQQFCQQLTFDPAREFADKSSQKVNAGKESVGLHIENGNTPLPPEYVAFYSAKSAKSGSQTTVCDGRELYKNMPIELQEKWRQKVTVSRTLPEHLWRKYVVDQHPNVSTASDVKEKHLADFIAVNPNQRGSINSDGSLDYELDIQPCLLNESAGQSNELAFANAILGPSFNYKKPTYTFADSTPVSDLIIKQTIDLAEKCTHEVNWQDGDVVLIDNKRVLHGRRAITGELADRQLYIAMGS